MIVVQDRRVPNGYICSSNVPELEAVGRLMPPDRWERRFRDMIVKRFSSSDGKVNGRVLLLFEERTLPTRHDLVGALSYHVSDQGIEILRLGASNDLPTQDRVDRALGYLLLCLEQIAIELAFYRPRVQAKLIWQLRDTGLADRAREAWGFTSSRRRRRLKGGITILEKQLA